MADIDDLLSGLLSAIVLVLQVALGTVLASLQYAFGGVRWWGGEVACSLCLVVFFLFVGFHVFFLVFISKLRTVARSFVRCCDEAWMTQLCISGNACAFTCVCARVCLC